MAADGFSEPPMDDYINWYSGMKPKGIWLNSFIYSRLWPHMDKKIRKTIGACLAPVSMSWSWDIVFTSESWPEEGKSSKKAAAEKGRDWHGPAKEPGVVWPYFRIFFWPFFLIPYYISVIWHHITNCLHLKLVAYAQSHPFFGALFLSPPLF